MKRDPATIRLLSEEEAAAVLRRGGATHATARTLRWLLQQPGAPARDDYQVDLAAVAAYLRKTARRAAPGLKGAAALFDKIVPEHARPRALTYAERQAKSRAKSSHADIAADLDAAFASVNWRRRARAERDFVYFMKTYGTSPDPTAGAFLEIPPPKEMQPILRDMAQAVGDASVPYHVRVFRGGGKTAYMKGTANWALAKGLRRYVVAVAANEGNAEDIINNIFSNMTQNPAFVQDFPEIAVPFLKLEGAYQRAKTQKYHGKPTNARRSASKIILPTINDPRTGRPFPSSGAILEALGYNSGARGKSRGILRPDTVLFDDLENDEQAKNEGRVEEMARKIKKTFMGLAGHRKKIAALMTSTPIEADDLSETFAADIGWKTKTYRMVMKWPACHDLDAPPEARKGVRDYWEEYWDIYDAEKAADRPPHVAANRFYRTNRREMDAGAEVLNPHNFDPANELSALQHAMNILHRDGLETFMSEYQMTPPRDAFAFEISTRLILSRIRRGVPARTIPPDTVLTVAATDINPAYALTTTVQTFNVDLTSFVTAYHVTPIRISDRLNDTEFDRRVTAALKAHGQELAALGIQIDRWGIDAGGKQFQTVTKFAAMSEAEIGIPAVAMLGRAGQGWNPNVRSRIRDERNSTILCRDTQKRRWIAWNADEYKERAQKAWATETGAAGGLSLYDGNANHYKFAAQIANERLKSKTRIRLKDGRDGFAYQWKTRNPHDYGDCVAMCYALAGADNITGTGTAATGSTRNRRKVYNG